MACQEFTARGLGNYVLAFHGSSNVAIDNIIITNFDLDRLASNTGNRGYNFLLVKLLLNAPLAFRWYGAGIYFSGDPR